MTIKTEMKILIIVLLSYLLLMGFGKPFWLLLIPFSLVMLVLMFEKKKIYSLILLWVIALLEFYNYIKIGNLYVLKDLGISNKLLIEYTVSLFFIFIVLIFSLDKRNLRSMNQLFSNWKMMLLNITVISEVVHLIMLVTGKGFILKWDVLRVYVGLFTSPHVCAYSLIIIMVVTIYIYILYNNNGYILLLLILPSILILFTGARTPTVCYFGILVTLYFFHIRSKNLVKGMKQYISYFLLFSSFLGVGNFLLKSFMNAPFYMKFIESSEAVSVLSGRDIFWSRLLNEVIRFDITDIAFGHGVYYTMYLNKKNYGMTIWGHNDLIDILVSYGIIVLFFYVILYVVFFLGITRFVSNKLESVILFTNFMLLMLFNGIVNYSFFSIIFIFIALILYSDEIESR